MVRESNEVKKEKKVAPFNGIGSITVRSILEGPEELYNKGRVFAHTTVHPGSKIGYHCHINESETYYILSGSGTYNDNGKITEVHPVYLFFCGAGEGHGIEASNEGIEMIELILYHT